jgi:hypothetical protein
MAGAESCGGLPDGDAEAAAAGALQLGEGVFKSGDALGSRESGAACQKKAARGWKRQAQPAATGKRRGHGCKDTPSRAFRSGEICGGR